MDLNYGSELLGLWNAACRTEVLITLNSVAVTFLWDFIRIEVHVTVYICSLQLSESRSVMEIIKNWIPALLKTVTWLAQLHEQCTSAIVISDSLLPVRYWLFADQDG